MNWQYIAGFFDGEGSINVTRRGKPTIFYRVDMSQKYPEALEAIQEFLGYGIIYHRYDGKRNIYELRINRKSDIIDFVTHVLPYSIVKREKIIWLLTKI